MINESLRPDGTPYPVKLDDAKFKNEVDPLTFSVLREGATEPAFVGEYTDTEMVGIYRCRACEAELFHSDTKFHSGCGWPSFYAPSESDAVVLLEDLSGGRIRTEVRCASCGSHMGHVFTGEGYETPTDERWCINSVSLRLEPRD